MSGNRKYQDDKSSSASAWALLFSLFAGILLATSSQAFAFAQNAPAPKPFVARSIPGKYVVTLADNVDPETIARQYGVAAHKHFRHALKGFSASISQETKTNLINDPRVIYVEPDQIVMANDTQANPTWGLDRIDQRNVPLDKTFTTIGTGAGVTAYVIDTGIRFDHSEFAGRATLGFDALGGNGTDCNGHGTHVAGTIGGQTYGVAKSVNLVAVRVLDCAGSGTLTGVIAGVDWVARNRKPSSVANMSLGGGISFALDRAVQNMIDQGVVTVVAAGNSNADACSSSPSRVSAAITVGAADQSDARASFSNYGKCVDFFAPGVNITSAWYSSTTATNTISGTSMASPHTAGVAALYLSGHPTASPVQVRDALLSFTTKAKITASNSTSNHLIYSYETVMGTGDYVSPSAALTNPATGTVLKIRSSVTLSANAADNVGVTKVEFYLNGNLLCTDTLAPYTCAWKTPSGATTVLIQAKSYDAVGNVGSTPIASIKIQ